MTYSDDKIKECYYKLLQEKVSKQKLSLEKKARQFECELDKRAEEFKRRITEDTKRQMELIDKNTENYKKQLWEEVEIRKQSIDASFAQQMEADHLNLEDVKCLIMMLEQSK